MATILFDSHTFVKRLQDAGMPPAQAEAFVQAQQEILAQALDSTLATKMDLLKLEAKVDKLQWMGGIIIAISIANFAKQFF